MKAPDLSPATAGPPVATTFPFSKFEDPTADHEKGPKMKTKERAIYYAEMHRREKSAAIAYLLLILFGSLMVHQAYLGNTRRFVVSVVWPFLALGFFFSAVVSSAAGNSDLMVISARTSAGCFVVTGVILLVDMLSIPSQVATRAAVIERRIRRELGGSV